MEETTPQSSYAKDIERIQCIIELISQKDCPIDDMLSYVKEATNLIERCQQKLARTDLEINETLKRLEEMKNN